MTTEEINRRFAELVGVEWHDVVCASPGDYLCSCGKRFESSGDYVLHLPPYYHTPDYCANPVLVLEVMMKLEYWGENWGVTIGSMLDKTGKIALEAIKWIEENI